MPLGVDVRLEEVFETIGAFGPRSDLRHMFPDGTSASVFEVLDGLYCAGHVHDLVAFSSALGKTAAARPRLIVVLVAVVDETPSHATASRASSPLFTVTAAQGGLGGGAVSLGHGVKVLIIEHLGIIAVEFWPRKVIVFQIVSEKGLSVLGLLFTAVAITTDQIALVLERRKVTARAGSDGIQSGDVIAAPTAAPSATAPGGRRLGLGVGHACGG